ncbi:MAG: hypothetical protein ABUK20_15120, partial [Anaerolineales bacterium]
MRKLVVSVLGILVLTGCASNTAEPKASPTTQITLDVNSPEPVESIPSPTAARTPTTIVQNIDSPTPTSDATPIPSLQLCSPLEIHPLEELSEIIGDPYDPPRPGREERHHGIDFGYYHYQDRDSML